MARIGTCRLNREGVSIIQTKYREGRWANIDAFCHAYSIPRSTYYELIARDRWFEQATIQDKLTALGIPAEDHARLCEFRDQSFHVTPSTVPLSLPTDNHSNNHSNVYPNNLPVQPTSFIGRENEKATVKSLLAANSLVTLTGAGGCGKTRLALQTAMELLPEYPDGVWLVELAALASPDLVPQALLIALGLREEPARSGIDTITTYLKSRALLLVIDNCEHLLLACAQLATSILRTCPNIKILATSREALAIAGETVWRVPPLLHPDSNAITPGNLNETEQLALLASYDAVRLFVERAHAVRTDFTLTGQNAAQIVETCRRLDGMPLAIELAAARTKSLSVQEINRHLDHRFQLLTGGSRTALPRQQTLRALMDWSYDLLTAQEKLFLHRLSVFAGGWTLEAAEEVCSEGGEEVLDLLTSLVDKSLVMAEIQDRGTRYRLLETVRQYAQERLITSGECEQASRRHEDYFLFLAELAEPQLSGAEQGKWLQRLEEEHENLRAGLDNALQSSSSALEPEVALRYCAAMGRFWLLRGHLSEGREWCARALGGETGKEQSAEQTSKIRQHRAKVLISAGELASIQSDYAPARACFEESLAISHQIEDHNGRAAALCGSSMLARYQGDYAFAQICGTEGLALYRETGNLSGIANALTCLGYVAHCQGNNSTAFRCFQESLGLYRQTGNPGGIARALNNLGNQAYCQGDTLSADTYYRESLAIRRTIGESDGIAMSLCNLGIVALSRGDYSTALPNFEEGLSICRQIGNRGGVAFNLHKLGDLAYAQGDDLSANVYYLESLAIRREIGDRGGVANTLNSLGNSACRQAGYVSARSCFEESLSIAREIGDRYEIAASLDGLGDVAIVEGNYALATTHYQESLALMQAIGDRSGIAHLLEAFAALIARKDAKKEATEEQSTPDKHHVSKGRSAQAVHLWGVADALRAEIQSPIPRGDRPAYDRAIAEVQQAMGDVAFNLAWETGRTMSLEQAITEVLSTDASAP